MLNTSKQYDSVISKCTEIFKNKTHDYGTAWRILRSSSITDQIFIKANRIRTIQETGSSKVNRVLNQNLLGLLIIASWRLYN